LKKIKAFAASLNKVPDIPLINTKGRNTAIRIKVVAIIANVLCLEPLYAAPNGVSPFSILVYIASVMISESSVLMPIARIKLSNTKILIDGSNIYNPRNDPIRLTGKATAGNITALRLPQKR
jgi:hypothetical protein